MLHRLRKLRKKNWDRLSNIFFYIWKDQNNFKFGAGNRNYLHYSSIQCLLSILYNIVITECQRALPWMHRGKLGRKFKCFLVDISSVVSRPTAASNFAFCYCLCLMITKAITLLTTQSVSHKFKITCTHCMLQYLYNSAPLFQCMLYE